MSEISSERASRALESLGWRTVDLPPKTRGPLGGVFESPFAIAAIVLGESTFRAEGEWRRCQGAFADVVGGGDLSREKDRYLVFVVEEVSEEDVPELEAALADTHFARKMCIETRGASLEDTFGDSVILVLCSQSLFRFADLGDDGLCRGGPDKGCGVIVSAIDVVVDRLD